MENFDQDLIAQLSGGQLGPPPGAPPGTPPGAPAAAPMAPPPPPKADPAPTQSEKASAKGEPTAGEAEEAITFIDLMDKDGTKRQYTPDQLRGTLDRYRDLNHKWQGVKPVADVVQQIMTRAKENGYEAKPGEVAELVQAAITAYISNPTMGNKASKEPPPGGDGKAAAPMSPPDDDDDEVLSKWEKENAVSLPPGYKNQSKSLKDLGSKLEQMLGMISKLAQGDQMQKAAAGTQQQAQEMQMSAAQASIKNNLVAAMQQNGIPPDAEQDFFVFAMQRGYAPEDFVDAQLAGTVVADYKANKDAPEVNRLREIAKRRQAYTGMTGGAPGGGGVAPQGGDSMLNSMIGSAMRDQNI
jgi:hypothetical protein